MWAGQLIYDGAKEVFPWLSHKGIYNRRYIAGTTIWSQHSWGNAVDLTDWSDQYDSVRMDEVVAWLRKQGTVNGVRIGTILWKNNAAHHDHAHVEGYPKERGTPPSYVPNYESDDNVEDVVKGVQRSLKAAGFDPGVVDGLWGPKTEAAHTSMCKAAAAKGSDVDASDFVSKAVFNDHRHAEGTTGKPLI